MSADDQDLRYERKFVVATPDAGLVYGLLRRHPAMFREVHSVRRVNSLYLDTPTLAAYEDNLDGNPDRAKARVRWYGDFFRPVADGILEIKAKAGAVGGKQRFALPPFTVDEHLGAAALLALARSVPGVTAAARALLDGAASASGNRYRRRYFLSADGRYRATVDDEITFLSLGRRQGPRVRERLHGRVVLELKYAADAEPDADRVCSWFPFRPVKHSKYARGVEGVGP
ncbi:MAG: VTC domain-containing protein [Acidimicrobiia bacterium]|nr:VTC domain-containing protein [Acidimicrobiia bacterium]